MEVQSGSYKKTVDYAKRHFSINAKRIVFQQKGVNNGKNLDTYARVIIRTDITPNGLPNLNTTRFIDEQIEDLNSLYKSLIDEAIKNPDYPAKLEQWNRVKIITLNGNKCINYSYIRKMKDQPQTYSEFYIFWRGNKQHTLNIEYRVRDAANWKEDLDLCVQTFKLK